MALKPCWPFVLQKYPSHKKNSQPAMGKYARYRLREKKISLFIHAAKSSSHI